MTSLSSKGDLPKLFHLLMQLSSSLKSRTRPNLINKHLITLDACKAFDVVRQDSLLKKIFLAGVDSSLWLTLPVYTVMFHPQ